MSVVVSVIESRNPHGLGKTKKEKKEKKDVVWDQGAEDDDGNGGGAGSGEKRHRREGRDQKVIEPNTSFQQQFGGHSSSSSWLVKLIPVFVLVLLPLLLPAPDWRALLVG